MDIKGWHECMLAASVVSNSLQQPMDCGLPDSYVHGDISAGIMEWVVMPSSKRSPNPGIETAAPASPCIAGRHFTSKTLGKPLGVTTSNLLLYQVLAMSTISFMFSKLRWFPLVTLGSYDNTSKLKKKYQLYQLWKSKGFDGWKNPTKKHPQIHIHIHTYEFLCIM